MKGSGETNHFNAWHIEQSAVKIHIEPLMTRICDGLTQAYLQPALKALGKDPERYCLWYDTAPLTVRPNRLQDTLNLFERGIVSAEAVRRAGDYKESTDKPDQEEENTRFIKELLLRDPTLFQNIAIREAIGIEIEEVDPLALPAGQEGDPNAPGPAPPPAPERAVDGSQPGQSAPDLPQQTRPQGRGGTSNGLIAGLEYVEAPSANSSWPTPWSTGHSRWPALAYSLVRTLSSGSTYRSTSCTRRSRSRTTTTPTSSSSAPGTSYRVC